LAGFLSAYQSSIIVVGWEDAIAGQEGQELRNGYQYFAQRTEGLTPDIPVLQGSETVAC
jgi:hypothetical protein